MFLSASLQNTVVYIKGVDQAPAFFFGQVAALQVSACFLLRLPFLLSFVTFVFALVHCFRSGCGMVWVEGFVSSLLTSFQDVFQKATNRAYLGELSTLDQVHVVSIVALFQFFAPISCWDHTQVNAFLFITQIGVLLLFCHWHSRVHAQRATF